MYVLNTVIIYCNGVQLGRTVALWDTDGRKVLVFFMVVTLHLVIVYDSLLADVMIQPCLLDMFRIKLIEVLVFCCLASYVGVTNVGSTSVTEVKPRNWHRTLQFKKYITDDGERDRILQHWKHQHIYTR